MAEKLKPFMIHGELQFAVDSHNRLCVNGDPVVTESKLQLSGLVTAAAVMTGGSTLLLALIELCRAIVWLV